MMFCQLLKDLVAANLSDVSVDETPELKLNFKISVFFSVG